MTEHEKLMAEYDDLYIKERQMISEELTVCRRLHMDQ